MHIGIELHFDPKTEAVVLASWHRLRDEGISSTMLDLEARPHVTLAAYGRPDGDTHREVRAFFASQASLPVRLGSVGTFSGPMGVVFMAPVVTPPLLDLHARLHAALSHLDDGAWPYYRPGEWVPHATVGILVSSEQLPQAVGVTRESNLPIEGRFDSAAICAFEAGSLKPVEVLHEFALEG